MSLTKAQIAKMFRQMRTESGLNQMQWARAIKASQSHVSKIEAGALEPGILVYFRALKALSKIKKSNEVNYQAR